MQSFNSSKTAEIMARYKPIAPRPDQNTVNNNPINGEHSSSTMNDRITESAYLSRVWPHLQARPTRTRKRGRTSAGPAMMKRSARPTYLQSFSPYQLTNSPAKNLSLHAFAHSPINALVSPQFILPAVPNFTPPPAETDLLTLPLLHSPVTEAGVHEDLDLNKAADVPEEKDLLQLLQATTISTTRSTTNVMAPRTIRLVGSSIRVESINKNPGLDVVVQVPAKAKEIEEDVESEALPMVISDSNNKVRLVNSAYADLVGQPECSWLHSLIGGTGACKRICGEVKLQVQDLGHVPLSSNGFFCWVRIEWGSNGKTSSIRTFCDAVRLFCKSRDYLFAWRFHTQKAADSDSNV